MTCAAQRRQRRRQQATATTRSTDTTRSRRSEQRVRVRGSASRAGGADARGQPRQHHASTRSTRAAWSAGRTSTRTIDMMEWQDHVREIAEQPARARGADRRLRRRQPERLRQGAQADRRRKPATTTCSATTRAIRIRRRSAGAIEIKVNAAGRERSGIQNFVHAETRRPEQGGRPSTQVSRTFRRTADIIDAAACQPACCSFCRASFLLPLILSSALE